MHHIITGATRGIGRAIAQNLAAKGLPTVLVARRNDAGSALAAEIGARFVPGDLSTVAGIRATAAALAGLPIASLIHNAGVWPRRREIGPDGLELAFVVNHLAPYLLNRLLADALAGARIVQVSAGLYVFGRVDLARTPTGESFSGLRTYADSKRCNVLLSRRYVPPGATLNLVHPGVVRTTLGEGGVGDFLLRPLKRFWLSPEVGALGPVRLATDPALHGVSGRWYDQEMEKPWHAASDAPELAEALEAHAVRVGGL